MAKSMRELGSDYERQTPPDYVNARSCYQKAADAGDAVAMYNLGELQWLL